MSGTAMTKRRVAIVLFNLGGPDSLEAVLTTGTAVAEVALCYTGNLLDPGVQTGGWSGRAAARRKMGITISQRSASWS